MKVEVAPPAAPPPAKEQPAAASAPAPAPAEPDPSPSQAPPPDHAAEVAAQLKNHEPHLGPRPRSHNKVLNPPGGKSSVVFY